MIVNHDYHFQQFVAIVLCKELVSEHLGLHSVAISVDKSFIQPMWKIKFTDIIFLRVTLQYVIMGVWRKCLSPLPEPLTTDPQGVQHPLWSQCILHHVFYTLAHVMSKISLYQMCMVHGNDPTLLPPVLVCLCAKNLFPITYNLQSYIKLSLRWNSPI